MQFQNDWALLRRSRDDWKATKVAGEKMIIQMGKFRRDATKVVTDIVD